MLFRNQLYLLLAFRGRLICFSVYAIIEKNFDKLRILIINLYLFDKNEYVLQYTESFV